MKKNKLYNYYRTLVIISSVITIFLSIVVEKNNGYQYIYFIPIVYLVAFILTKSLHIYSRKHIGLLILNILMYIRYVISTAIVIIKKDFGVPGFYAIEILDSSNSLSIFLIIIEMISIFFIIAFFTKLFYKNRDDDDSDVNIKIEKNHIGIVLTVFIFISFVFIVKYPENFFPKKIFFFDGTFVGNENNADSIEAIFYIFKTILMGILINNFLYKFQKNNKFKYILYSYITILGYVLLNTGISRLNMVLPLALFVLITNKFFKARGRILLYASMIILITSISAITLYKSSWRYSEDATSFEVMFTAIGDIQEYTSFIRPVAIGIQATGVYNRNITINTFFNDIFGSIPIISHYINLNDRINTYYNNYALNYANTSQIIPMVIISKSYFTIFFSWLLTDICVILLMMFDSKKNRTNFLSMYMSLYLSFTLAFSIFSNTQTLSGRIFIRYLPVTILCCLDRKIRIKHKKIRLKE